jgi:hypothetical protein
MSTLLIVLFIWIGLNTAFVALRLYVTSDRRTSPDCGRSRRVLPHPAFPPEPQQCGFVVAHDDARVRASDKAETTTFGFGRRRI